MSEIFEDKYSTNHQGNGVWMVIKGSPDYQSAKDERYCMLMRFERRLVDYFYEKLYEKKDSHRHWVVVVKYGSKTIYVNTELEKFSDWFYSDSILVRGGHNWEYKNRITKHKKYRNKPKD